MTRNFEFLRRYHPLLTHLGVQAEAYAFTDPNAAIVKLRQFGELLVLQVAARAGVDLEEGANQFERIRFLANLQLLPRQIVDGLHVLRKGGNHAAHGLSGSTPEALTLLRKAHEVAVWFNRAFGDGHADGVTPFIEPGPPVDPIAELRGQLIELRNEIGKRSATTSVPDRNALFGQGVGASQDALKEELKKEFEALLRAERRRFDAELARLREEARVRSHPEQVPAAPRERPQPPTAERDPEPPRCPDPACGAPMMRRVARRGPNAGSEFWGCTRYPKCRQTKSIANEVPAATSEAARSAATTHPRQPAKYEAPRVWHEAGMRPGWRVHYGSCGGRLRAYDPLERFPSRTFSASASHVAVLSRGDELPRAGEALDTVIQVLRRLLARGIRPPVDPRLEHCILERAGLLPHTRPARHPGDLARELDEFAPRPSEPDILAALTHRESFTADRTARISPTEPLLDEEGERQFLEEWVPRRLGSSAGHWILPQASLDLLVSGDGVGGGRRRVDFLVCHPASRPLVVEIDGLQHRTAEAVDAERDAELAGAGIDVVRVSARDARLGEGTDLQRIVEWWQRLPTGPAPARDVLLLVWAPAVAHRIALGIVEALDNGWLTQHQWALRVEEPFGIAGDAVRVTLELLSSIGAIWGVDIAPERVTLRTRDGFCALLQTDIGSYEVIDSHEPPSDESVDVVLAIEPFHGPFHELPRSDSQRQVLIRSALLPVDLTDERAVGGRRRLLPSPASASGKGLRRVLQAVFGKRDFQPEGPEPRSQEIAIRRLLAGRDTVVLLPTGAGKSLIYQMAGLLMPGVTLIIDPIVSLIDDQLDGLRTHGIDRAIGITSSDTRAGRTEAKLQRVRSGEALFVFVAPERLQQRSFREALRSLSVATPVNIAVVDEAHCVSEWGHDFRTSYLDIGQSIRSVTQDSANAWPPLLALTGTASRAVLKDMLIELSVDRSDPDVIVSLSTFDRRELRFSVVNADDDEVLPRLLGVLRSLPTRFADPAVRRAGRDFFRPRGRDTTAGIIFCQTVNSPERGVVKVSRAITDELRIPAPIYSGSAPHGWAGFDKQKRRNAADFKANATPLLVATKAYGMGIDKPNVRYIIHVGIPGSIEAYYQEAGRAGRDRREAQCIILHTPGDRAVHEFFHGRTFRGVEADVEDVRQVLELIGKIGERRTIKLPMGSDDQRERAIHRLKLLGVVDRYLVDRGSKAFDLRLGRTTAESMDRALLEFIRRSQPGRVAGFERELARLQTPDLASRVLALARLMIAYVYETIVAARKRAADEMMLLADSCSTDEQIRDRILRYIELSHVASRLDEIVDKEPFSFAEWQDLYDSINTPDDAREWRGATARMLESEPDHPGLLVGRGLAEALVTGGNQRLFADSVKAGLQSALEAYVVPAPEVARVAEWMIEWTRQRCPAWAAHVYFACEAVLGDAHLDYLGRVEASCLETRQRVHPNELGAVLRRRSARFERRLRSLARRHVEAR